MVKKNDDIVKLGSAAEDLFIKIFSDVFGPDKTKYLYIQYPVVDVYGRNRFIDFALENEKIAIEIDGEIWHNTGRVSDTKYYDDLLKGSRAKCLYLIENKQYEGIYG